MLTGMATFLLVIIALLAVPVSLTFQLSGREHIQGKISLRWLFGLVRLQLPPFTPKSPIPEGAGRAARTGRLRHSSRNRQHVSALVRQKAFRRRIGRYIRDCWSAIHKRDLRLHLRVGLGDPADTGQLWAVVGPVAGMLANAREASIEIVPEFLDETFELNSSGKIRLVPLQMLYLTLGLLFSPAVWKGIRRIRAAN
jgi:hypothetical protein